MIEDQRNIMENFHKERSLDNFHEERSLENFHEESSLDNFNRDSMKVHWWSIMMTKMMIMITGL